MKISSIISISMILADLRVIRQKKIRIKNTFADIVYNVLVKKSLDEA